MAGGRITQKKDKSADFAMRKEEGEEEEGGVAPPVKALSMGNIHDEKTDNEVEGGAASMQT